MGYNPWGRKELDMTWWLNNNKRHINTSLVNKLLKYFQMLLKSKLKRHCFEIWLRKFQLFTRWMTYYARIFHVIPWLHPLFWMEHWGLHLPGVFVSWLPRRCGHWVTLVEKCKVSRERESKVFLPSCYMLLAVFLIVAASLLKLVPNPFQTDPPSLVQAPT